MQRRYDLYLNDILVSIEKIEKYTKDISQKELENDNLIVDAVLRNLEIIGECVSMIPETIKKKQPNIEWAKIRAFRNIAAHRYWAVDSQIVWDIVENKLDSLKMEIRKILDELDK